MTLEKANEIRRLLNLRDVLISQLNKFKECDCIDGHINEGANGLGFKWEKDGREIKYLIEGILKDIKDIEETVFSFQ